MATASPISELTPMISDFLDASGLDIMDINVHE